MPHLVKVENWHRGGNVLEHRAACAVQIAMVMSQWAGLEEVLGYLFAFGMQDQLRREGMRDLLPFDPTAQAVMDELDSIHARLKIVRRALIDRLPKDEQVTWAALEKRVAQDAKIRNKVAHTDWGASEKFPGSVLRKTSQVEAELWTEQDFRSANARIRETRAELMRFWSALGNHAASTTDGRASPPAQCDGPIAPDQAAGP